MGLIMMGSVLVLVIVGFSRSKILTFHLCFPVGWALFVDGDLRGDRTFYVHLDFLPDHCGFRNVNFISFLNFIGSCGNILKELREVMYWFSLKGTCG